MKINRLFTNALVTLALMASASAEVVFTPLTQDKLLGRWRGGDTNDLNCMLVFERGKAKIYTFRREKQLSTLYAYYSMQPGDGKVELGVEGEAAALPDGKLQLKITRQFDHIVVLREATLQRMPDPKYPMLITTFGTNTSPGGSWRVVVSESDGSLRLSRFTESAPETTNPQGWTAQTGWFAYFESESRFWAYDGDQTLYLLSATPERSTIYGPRRFPVVVPEQVFSRLSQSAQRAIDAHE
jgi:hypothetical protein